MLITNLFSETLWNDACQRSNPSNRGFHHSFFLKSALLTKQSSMIWDNSLIRLLCIARFARALCRSHFLARSLTICSFALFLTHKKEACLNELSASISFGAYYLHFIWSRYLTVLQCPSACLSKLFSFFLSCSFFSFFLSLKNSLAWWFSSVHCYLFLHFFLHLLFIPPTANP